MGRGIDALDAFLGGGGIVIAPGEQVGVGQAAALEIGLEGIGHLEGTVHVAVVLGVGQDLLKALGDRIALRRQLTLDHAVELGSVFHDVVEGLVVVAEQADSLR